MGRPTRACSLGHPIAPRRKPGSGPLRGRFKGREWGRGGALACIVLLSTGGDGARPRFGRICRLTVRRLTIRRSQEPHRQARPGRAGSRMTRTRTETRNSGGGRNARMHARTRTHLRLSSATPRLRSSPPPPLASPSETAATRSSSDAACLFPRPLVSACRVFAPNPSS